MESEKTKVETLFGEVEQRLADTSKLTVAERRKELEHLEPALVGLTREFERFQMIAFNKYPSEIDEMEERLTRIQATVARMSVEDITLSGLQNEPKLQESDVVMEEADPTTQLVALTNAKLDEGKARALNMLKLANNMRDELNMMDDEVMLQREKLLSINNQIKHAQSVTNQTKRLVSYFTKAVNDDKIVRGLIVVVAVLLLVIVSMALSIKMRRGKLVELKVAEERQAQEKADYSKIDEKYFAKLATSLALDTEKGMKAAMDLLASPKKDAPQKLQIEPAKEEDAGVDAPKSPFHEPDDQLQEQSEEHHQDQPENQSEVQSEETQETPSPDSKSVEETGEAQETAPETNSVIEEDKPPTDASQAPAEEGERQPQPEEPATERLQALA